MRIRKMFRRRKSRSLAPGTTFRPELSPARPARPAFRCQPLQDEPSPNARACLQDDGSQNKLPQIIIIAIIIIIITITITIIIIIIIHIIVIVIIIIKYH